MTTAPHAGPARTGRTERRVRTRRPAGDARRRIQLRRSSSRAGLTLVELAVVMVVLLVAVSILSGSLVAMSKQRSINRENAIATGVARDTIEAMRNENFRDVFALFNSDASDDPVGRTADSRLVSPRREPPGSPSLLPR